MRLQGFLSLQSEELRDLKGLELEIEPLSSITETQLVDVGALPQLKAHDLIINGHGVRAIVIADDVVSSAQNTCSAIAIATAINASIGDIGLVAAPKENMLNLGIFTPGALTSASFQINGVNIISSGADVTTLMQDINAQSQYTGVASVLGEDGNIFLVTYDGRNIQLTTDGEGIGTFEQFTTNGHVPLNKIQRAAITLTYIDAPNLKIEITGANPMVAGFNAGIIQPPLNPDMIEILCHALSQCHSLHTFIFGKIRNNYSTLALQEICTVLSQLPNLQAISFNFSDLGLLDIARFQILCNLFSQCNGLTFLDFSDRCFENIDIDKCQILKDTFSRCHSLKTLIFSNGGLAPYYYAGALEQSISKAFFYAITSAPNLQRLNLFCNGILDILDVDNFQALCHSLSQCHELRLLDLGRNNDLDVEYFGAPGIGNISRLDAVRFQTLGNALKQCHNFKEISFYSNKLHVLNKTTFQGFCYFLTQCYNLEILVLSGNQLGSLDAERFSLLCDALLQCHKLQTLYLDDNHLNEWQIQLLQNVVKTRQEQFNIVKNNTKAFLLSWNRLRKQETPTLSLGALPKLPVMEILYYAGYICSIPTGVVEFTRKPLTIKFS